MLGTYGESGHSLVCVCLHIPLVSFYLTPLSTAFEKVCGVKFLTPIFGFFLCFLSKLLYVECQFDLCVACYALTYFEKLVFCERVSKANRRYSAACCAILAAKMNDIKGQQLKKLVSNLCSIYKINRSDLLNFEFPVLVALKFNLHLSTSLLRPMYSSLKQTLT